MRLAGEAVVIAETSIKNGHAGAILMPTLLVRRSNVELAAHRTQDAVSDAERAVSLLRASAVPRNFLQRDRARLSGACEALAAESKTDEARAAARSAAEQLQNAVGPDHPDTRRARQLS